MGGRLFYLQIIKSYQFGALAEGQHTFYYKIPPRRGKILDSKLRNIAVSFDIPSCYANPRRIKNKDEVAQKISEYFGIDYENVRTKLAKDKAFVWIKRYISQQEKKNINQLDGCHVGFVKESKRFYPDNELTAHVVGFVGIDNTGLEGLEFYYNDYLKGSPGLSLVGRDAKGRHIESESETIYEALDGLDIVLTIDKYIQYVAERELDKAYKKYKAKGGTIIVMNSLNGEILAMSSRPTYNPNAFNDSPADARRNRAVSDIFEPGSVFKVVTAAVALEEEVVSLDETIYCENGAYKVANHVLHDHKPYKDLSFKGVIEHSSNIGTVKVASRLDENVFYDYMLRFGFGAKTDIDFPMEEKGIVKDPTKWSRISIAAIPIGQEIAVTALQMITSIAVIANDGYLVQPHLVRHISDNSGNIVKEFNYPVKYRVISQKISKNVREIMQAVVETGTGKRARIKGYVVCGKTGTAQKIEPTGGYSHSKFMATFGGFILSDDINLAIIVVLDEPRPVYYGGTVSAPVFKNVAEEIIKYLQHTNK
ncbi:MAG: penicillin-binding protein 2 [Candidatus Kappaea frigidicola]|nr:penicillin-binding protein 2 [Candidatus Kappaea frigidicola]